MTTKTILMAVKDQCANYMNTHCIDADEQCVMHTAACACSYFDDCILPWIAKHPEWESALLEYVASTKDMSHHSLKFARFADTQSRTCEGCGGAVDKGHSFCNDCIKKRRRVQARDAMRRKRGLGC